MGVAVITGVIAVAPSWGMNLLTIFSFGRAAKGIGGFNQATPAISTASAQESQSALTDKGPMPSLAGAIGWLNSSPLNYPSLRGKVVLINFWTYTCINSLRPLPYVKSWAAKYKGPGLVVIGVHTPEFSFEK